MDEQMALPTKAQLSALRLVHLTGTGPFPKDPESSKRAFYECEHLGWIRYAHDGEFRLTESGKAAMIAAKAQKQNAGR